MSRALFSIDSVQLRDGEEAKLVYLPQHKPNDVAKLIKLQKFAAHYALSGNGKDAVEEVYELSGQSAANKACRLLKNTYVDALVTAYAKELASNLGANQAYVIRRLKEFAELDLADVIDENGNVKPIKEWSNIMRKAVSKIEIKTTKEVNPDGKTTINTDYKFALPDKLKTLETLGRHVSVGAFKDTSEVNVTVTGIDSLHQKRLGGGVEDEGSVDEEF